MTRHWMSEEPMLRVHMLTYLLHERQPPTPFAEDWVPVCLDACDLVRAGEGEDLVRLPYPIMNPNTGKPYDTAANIVKAFGLEHSWFAL